MRKTFVTVVAGLLVLQVLLFGIIWGSPQLKLERSYTATPSATPRLPDPTPIGPTPIPTLVPVGLGAPTLGGGAGECGRSTLQCAGAGPDWRLGWRLENRRRPPLNSARSRGRPARVPSPKTCSRSF